MASSGIKKYDRLPSRIGFKDVDALRASYAITFNKYLSARNKLIKIKQDLENIYQKYQNDKNK